MGYTRDENGLFMRGRLIEPLTAEHDAYGETLYLGKIEIMRLSGTADTLPITVPGRLMKGFRIGDTIEFNGELRSYNRHVDGANRLLLRPFARRIECCGRTAAMRTALRSPAAYAARPCSAQRPSGGR